MNTQKSTLMLKKSIVSLGVLSLLTAAVIEIQEYQKQDESLSFSEHLNDFVVPAKVNGETMYFKNNQDLSILTTDANELAAIAENNLYVEPVNQQQNIIKPTSLALTTGSQSSDVDKVKQVQDDRVLADIYFALSSSELAPQYKTQLVKVAQQIKASNADKQWQVVGHTDKSGSASYNLKLAKQRANKVLSFLLEQGVAEKQLSVLTLGEYKAMHLENSTYNSGLRKVQVIDFKPGLENLAQKVQRDNQKIQRRLLAQQKAKALLAEQQVAEQQEIAQQDSKVQQQLLLEQQQVQQQVAAIKTANNLPEIVQVNTDLQLNGLDLVEQEEHLWSSEQPKETDQQQQNSNVNTQTNNQVNDQVLSDVNDKPTAMVTTTRYLF
ncbi:OmpA family protein [Psychromonas aquatilis]|uniref:OmpA family protein n=1 Tax=Psychromonas aquatilis TaxID=2005072 RepID=A0ABU9GRP5_9GAMM